MRSFRSTLYSAGLLGALLLSAVGAQAQVYTAPGAPPAPSGSNFQYLYQAAMATGTQINTGDGFTLVDVNGYVPGSVVFNPTYGNPTSWGVNDTTDPGTFAAAAFTTDNPAIKDITFVYGGSSPIVASTMMPFTPLFAYNFTDSDDITANGIFVTESHNTMNQNSNLITTQTQLPSSRSTPPPVPEPAFFQMGALLGMGALGYLKRRRA